MKGLYLSNDRKPPRLGKRLAFDAHDVRAGGEGGGIDFEEAEEQLVSTCEIFEGQRGSEDRFTRSALRHLVALYESWGKPEEATHYRALLESAQPVDE